MFRLFPKKTRNTVDFPNDPLMHTLSFLDVKDISNVTRVSKQWADIFKTDDFVLKNVVLTSLKKTQVPLKYELLEETALPEGKKVDWKKFYTKVSDNEQKREELQEIKDEIQKLHEFQQAAVEFGAEPPAFVIRKDTCFSGCLGAGCFGGITYAITYFACKEFSCLFTTLHSLGGCLLGMMRRTDQLEQRAKSDHLTSPLLGDVLVDEKSDEDEENNKKIQHRMM
jgi:hypothetical protein